MFCYTCKRRLGSLCLEISEEGEEKKYFCLSIALSFDEAKQWGVERKDLEQPYSEIRYKIEERYLCFLHYLSQKDQKKVLEIKTVKTPLIFKN